MPDKKTIIGDIEGGQAPSKLLPSDNITVQHLWDTYRWYPGFEDMHALAAKAIWANGLTDDTIPQDRILEMKLAQEFCFLCGYVAVVVRSVTTPPSIEFIHPEIDGIGFVISKTSDFGYPTQIQVKLGFNENNVPISYYVDNYPVETLQIQAGVDENGEPIMKPYHVREKPEKGGSGFFLLRTHKGKKGLRGLPQFLQLMHPVRAQSDILDAYVPYAEKQGMGFPAIFLEDNTPANRTRVKTQFSSQPQTNRLLLLSNLDLVEWIQPTQGSYDPTFILQWIDALIARKTQMNKLMLEGDPAGYLSASETAISNWTKEVKENQVFWRSQWHPIWLAMGASDDCGFQDPDKPSFISLMEGIKAIREGLEGFVEPEDIVNLMNEYLQKSDKQYKLRALPKEEMMDKDGNSGSNEDNGNKDKKQPNK